MCPTYNALFLAWTTSMLLIVVATAMLEKITWRYSKYKPHLAVHSGGRKEGSNMDPRTDSSRSRFKKRVKEPFPLEKVPDLSVGEAVGACLAAGYGVSFGMTRDRSTVVVTLLDDGSAEKEYCSSVEALEEVLAGLSEID